MDLPLGLLLLVIGLSLVFSAFFSGMEIAFVSSNKLRIELDKKQGKFPARILSIFVERPSKFIAAMLLGNNIALVVYGLGMAQLIEPSLREYVANDVIVLLVQTIVSTLIILVTAEFLPKTIFHSNPNWWLGLMAVPLMLIWFLLYVPTLITVWLSNLVLRMLKLEVKEEQPAFGRVDLDNYVKEMTERTEEQEELDAEIQIFQNALEFSKVKARDCMVPRNEIVALDVEDSIDNLREKFIETGLSKILIYRDNIDNIIGYTHSYELFKRPEHIKNILLPISIIPEAITANNILEMFISSSRSVAIVVDEFGGTSGLVTIEDVVEEIFGEIEDEHDVEALPEEQLSEVEFKFSGRLEIDYLNEKYKLSLPESEDYETLAGLILFHLERIPESEDVIEVDSFIFTISEVSDHKIDLVHVVVKPEDKSE